MKLIFFLCLISLFSSPSMAQNDNSTSQICSGSWVLSNEAGWSVRSENGVILPLTSATLVLGCARTPIKLYQELAGASAEVKCAASNFSFGLPDVTTITIICK